MFGLLDRLAALQLALQPHAITQTLTGVILVNYGVSVPHQAALQGGHDM
jgi:hypothetical protein